jgi:hypothetical protein
MPSLGQALKNPMNGERIISRGGVLLASIIHHSLFSTANLVGWLWFGSFLLCTLALAALSVISLRSARLASTDRDRMRPALGEEASWR